MLPTRTTVLLLSAGLLLWLGGMAAQAMETVLPAWLAPTVVLGSHWLVLGFDGCVVAAVPRRRHLCLAGHARRPADRSP